MFGNSILVAPVYGDFNTMEIFLPPGNDWIDYWDKKKYGGGQLLTYNTTDAEKLPLFIRSGAIIPMRKEQNWIEVGEIWDPLTLDLYPDTNSSFILYEDDGRTIYYQDGQFAKTLLECSRGSEQITLTINKTEGEYRGKPDMRTFLLQLNLDGSQPGTVTVNNKEVKKVPGPDSLEEEITGWTLDGEPGAMIIKLQKKASIKSEIVVFLISA
jgi:alpha-glucosidase (family GH31 glycosyl hydrolase)